MKKAIILAIAMMSLAGFITAGCTKKEEAPAAPTTPEQAAPAPEGEQPATPAPEA